MELSILISSFVAGLLMFLAPCTLPLVPAYLSFIAGSNEEAIKKAQESDRHRSQLRNKVVMNGIFYVLGFSMIFIFFGVLAGFVGVHVLGASRILLTRLGGIFVILFGLFMLDIVKIPFLQQNRSFVLSPMFKAGRPESSFMLGAAFAFGWAPCIGPLLASILLLASTSSTALQGGMYLAVFSLGMAIPFLLIAWGIGSAFGTVKKISQYMPILSKLGGIFLLLIGLLLITNNFGLLISFGYDWFGSLGYEKLLEYY